MDIWWNIEVHYNEIRSRNISEYFYICISVHLSIFSGNQLECILPKLRLFHICHDFHMWIMSTWLKLNVNATFILMQMNLFSYLTVDYIIRGWECQILYVSVHANDCRLCHARVDSQRRWMVQNTRDKDIWNKSYEEELQRCFIFRRISRQSHNIQSVSGMPIRSRHYTVFPFPIHTVQSQAKSALLVCMIFVHRSRK